MLTDESRKRLCAWEGRCWHDFVNKPRDFDRCKKCRRLWTNVAFNPAYKDWNSVIPLLAKIAADGAWTRFERWAYQHSKNVGVWKNDTEDLWFELWLHGRYTDPEHTAGLVDKWLAGKEVEYE
jgi:hypothetical protein